MNVVVLEDEVRIARRIARLVSQEAHAVRIAPLGLAKGARGTKAARIERERRMLWADVAVIDVGDPHDDRMDAFLAMAKRHPTVVFVVCADEVDDPRLDRASDDGHAVVAKPFSSIEIRAAVEAAARRRKLNELEDEQAA